jgi:hypothetical protein
MYFMQRKRRPVIFVADAMEGMKALVAKLNRTEGEEWDASALELREIVKQWQDSGPNLSKLFHADPTLFVESNRAFRPSLIPTKSGHANLRLLDNAGAPGVMASLGKIGIRFEAMVWFNALTLNPLWQKLAGPCARCGNYYIKKRASQKVYCSRRCGNAATAVARTRKRTEDERKDKLLRSKAALREWRSTATQEDWKPWVAKRAGVDLRFLTQAVTKRDLLAPSAAGKRIR